MDTFFTPMKRNISTHSYTELPPEQKFTQLRKEWRSEGSKSLKLGQKPSNIQSACSEYYEESKKD